MEYFSIVVPVYNEEEIIDEFFTELTQVLYSLRENYEIIYVTGGNTDRTLEKLKILAATDKHVKIIKLSHRFDYQAALSAGLEHASGKAVISMDGDLQHPPEIIPQMILAYKNGNDIVYTIREDAKGTNFFKKTGTQIFYFLFRHLTRVNIEENAADFRLLSKNALTAFKQFPERKRYIPGIVSILGFKKIGIRYLSRKRIKGKSKFSFVRLFTLALDAIFSFSNIPIRIITALGVLISFFSFAYLSYVIIWKFIHPNENVGWPSILATLLFFSGLQIFVLGILGEYIGRIYEEVKFRPIYIVEEFIGFDKF